MDIQRPDLAQKNKSKKRNTIIVTCIVLLILVSFLISYKPGPFSVEKNLIYIGTVQQGEMLQQLSGVGTLEAAEIRWVSARTSGRVERIFILPGAQVSIDTIILEMSNPELLQRKQNAELQVKTDEANYLVRKARLESNLLQNLSALKKIESEYKRAQLNAEIDKQLFERGLEAKQTSLRSNLLAEQLKAQLSLEEQRYQIATNSISAEITAEKNLLEQSKANFALLVEQVDALAVKAGYNGLLQKQNLKEGQQVAIGQSIAQVVNPNSLKANISVQEHLAKRINIGLKATIDTRNGLVAGVVSRIDPNVEEGSVTIDVELTGEIPPGVRPNSSIEALIEIQKLDDVTHVSRPLFAKADSSSTLFKFNPDSDVAEQVKVEFGQSSVNDIVIKSGLSAGDRIILSDTSEWMSHEKISVN